MRKCWINWKWLPLLVAKKPRMMPWKKVRKSSRKEINICLFLLAEKYSWEAVNCYVQEPLACNSDDEKCIRRAVKESKTLKVESKKPLKTSGATNWPFSAVVHLEPEFLQREADSYSCVKAKIGCKPKQRVFSLRKTRALRKKPAAHLSPQPQREKHTNFKDSFLTHVSIVMLILI